MANQQQNFRMKSLGFFGNITASVTHELNNVIAIINELTGLLDDMRYSVDQGQVVESERLEKIRSRFARQVTRGELIIKRLNKFAHTSDYVILEADLSELLTNLTELLQRPANLKNVKMIYEPAAEPMPITGNIFELQHAIYRCIRLFLDNAESGAEINLLSEKIADQFRIIIKCAPFSRDIADNPDVQFVGEVIASLDGKLELNADDNIFSFRLILPVAKSVSDV